VAALLYAFNPSVLYVAMTAMTETATLFFAIAALDALHRWSATPADRRRDRTLLLASLCVAGATLCRYEAWPLAMAVPSLAFLSTRGAPGGLPARSRALAITAVGFAGIAAWLAWNALVTGDPLHFAHAPYYSAAWQARHRPAPGGLHLRPLNVLAVYGATTAAAFGVVFAGLGLAGAALALRRRPALPARATVAAAAIMPAFTLAALTLGIAEMTFWWNSRYVLLLAPLLSVGLAEAVVGMRRRLGARGLAVAIALAGATTVGQIAVQPGRVVAIADAAGGFRYGPTPDATEMGDVLARMYAGGAILMATGSAQAHRVMQPSGIPLRRYVLARNGDPVALDVRRIARAFTWVLIGRTPDSDGTDSAGYLLARRGELEAGYAPAHENASYLLLRRRTAP
jgi:hypothetical protein